MLRCLERLVPFVECFANGSDERNVVLDQVEQVEGVGLCLASMHLLHLLLNPGQVRQRPREAVSLLHAGQGRRRLREGRGRG